VTRRVVEGHPSSAAELVEITLVLEVPRRVAVRRPRSLVARCCRRPHCSIPWPINLPLLPTLKASGVAGYRQKKRPALVCIRANPQPIRSELSISACVNNSRPRAWSEDHAARDQINIGLCRSARIGTEAAALAARCGVSTRVSRFVSVDRHRSRHHTDSLSAVLGKPRRGASSTTRKERRRGVLYLHDGDTQGANCGWRVRCWATMTTAGRKTASFSRTDLRPYYRRSWGRTVLAHLWRAVHDILLREALGRETWSYAARN